MPLSKARLRISDYNDKRKARVKGQEKKIIMASLSLTSMVDMFAILVIFLLANSSTVSQWVEVGHGIDLPKAKFSDPPPKAVTLQVSKDAVWGESGVITKTAIVSQSALVVDPIRIYLSKVKKKEGYVNIVAHSKVSFGVIRKIIATCQEAGFKNVNLAVQPKAGS